MLFNRRRLQTLREENPFLPAVELAYQMLLESLLDGHLRPGDHLNQSDLAEQLDMSRSPVRDALLRLEDEGFVLHDSRGFQVPLLEGQDFADFMEFRTEMECVAARLATHYATREQLQAMERNLEAYQKAIAENDRPAATRLDSAFHELVAEAAGNAHLRQVYRQVIREARFYLIRLVPRQVVELNLKRHRAIWQAVADRDENAAEAAVRTHMADAMRTALRVQTDQKNK